LGLVRLVAAEYAGMENGYHARLRDFLRRAYTAYELFRAFPETYGELKQDSFWKNSRQKPKGLTTSRWILYFIMRATKSNDRARATKYAVILDGLSRDKVKPGVVAARIKEMGGIEAACEAMRARKRGDAKRSQSRDEDEEHDETRTGTSPSTPSSDELFDPEEDLSIRVRRETHVRVLGSEVGVGDSFYLECRKTRSVGRDGIRIIGRLVELVDAPSE
jgi:hypothetical protein